MLLPPGVLTGWSVLSPRTRRGVGGGHSSGVAAGPSPEPVDGGPGQGDDGRYRRGQRRRLPPCRAGTVRRGISTSPTSTRLDATVDPPANVMITWMATHIDRSGVAAKDIRLTIFICERSGTCLWTRKLRENGRNGHEALWANVRCAHNRLLPVKSLSPSTQTSPNLLSLRRDMVDTARQY
jgi:hypothetical protein